MALGDLIMWGSSAGSFPMVGQAEDHALCSSIARSVLHNVKRNEGNEGGQAIAITCCW